jgi:hypothetical protein
LTEAPGFPGITSGVAPACDGVHVDFISYDE